MWFKPSSLQPVYTPFIHSPTAFTGGVTATRFHRKVAFVKVFIRKKAVDNLRNDQNLVLLSNIFMIQMAFNTIEANRFWCMKEIHFS